MKTITLLSILAVGSSFAGEPVVFDKNPVMPPPAPTLYQWFAGGTVGYLIDNDEELYTAHVGVDLPEQLNGWDQALYLEVGYAEFDHHANREYFGDYQPGSEIEGVAAGGEMRIFADLDLEMVPITINYKLEKQVSQTLNAYVGAGLGIALFDADVSGFVSDSDDDTVLFGQVFGGVLYNVNPSFELFAGLRAIYFDEPEFNLAGAKLDSDHFGVENFDVSADIGGRINF